MVDGPHAAGLAVLAPLDGDARLAGATEAASVRDHLLEMAGATRLAPGHYQGAARRTAAPPRAALPRVPSRPPQLTVGLMVVQEAL